MNLESACARVFLIAAGLLTDKRLKARVGQLMRLQVPLRDELLPTLSASEGTLSSVRAHVSLKVTCLLELLKTALIGANE